MFTGIVNKKKHTATHIMLSLGVKSKYQHSFLCIMSISSSEKIVYQLHEVEVTNNNGRLYISHQSHQCEQKYTKAKYLSLTRNSPT